MRVYDDIASDYATNWFDDSVMVQAIEEFVHLLESTGDILDAGCGPGRDVLALENKGFTTVGIDLSSAMLAEARARVGHAIFRRMDMRQLQYPPETFAGIWACASLQHLTRDEARQTLKGFTRVLKPAGVLSISVKAGEGENIDGLGRYEKLYTVSDFNELVSTSGFKVVREVHSLNLKRTIGCLPQDWLNVLAIKSSTPENNSISDNECVFCPASRFNLCRQIGLPTAGSILWGNDHLFVIPDIAPLAEGHLLIIASDHLVCFGAIPKAMDHSLQQSEEWIRKLFQETYQRPPLFFEHGPARSKEVGACIDHAHLHCLPASLSLRRSIECYFGPGQRASIDTLRRLYGSGQSYLYIQEDPYEGRVYLADNTPSQFFRQIIALEFRHRTWRWQTSFKREISKHVYLQTLNKLLPLVDHFLNQD